MSETVLITGGAGFIGSHITDKFINNGMNVIIVDNYSSPNSGYRNEKAKYIEADILSEEMESVFQEHKIDYCIHLAAQASVAVSVNNPLYDAKINILGSINVIELCKKYSIKKFITASSAAVYGNPKYLPVDEKHSTDVLSQYGLSKLTMEKYIKLSELDYIIFRFANVYGERQNSQGEAGVIAIFADAMRNNNKIYIDGDGTQTRDFVYVKDIADVVYAGITSDVKNEIINVSTNHAVSINMLFSTMQKYYNYEHKPVYREKREGDIKDSILDNSKVKSLLKIDSFKSLDFGLKTMKEV